MQTFISSISQKEFSISEQVYGKTVRKSIFDVILKDPADFNKKSSIALSELNHYRQKYLASYLVQELGELSHLEEDVLKTLNEDEIISEKVALCDDLKDTGIGQQLADKVASFGGSWKFIILKKRPPTTIGTSPTVLWLQKNTGLWNRYF